MSRPSVSWSETNASCKLTTIINETLQSNAGAGLRPSKAEGLEDDERALHYKTEDSSW